MASARSSPVGGATERESVKNLVQQGISRTRWIDCAPMATEVQGVEGMKALLGQEVGPSEWRTIAQADIDAFAELSGDHQWIHVDPERAKTESPYGTTIAHGNLTLATVDGFRTE